MTGHAAPIVVGEAIPISPLVRRLTAPNPGVMTGPGTNTYLVGRDEVVVVDPGPNDPSHLDAIVAAGAGRIVAIVVTHTHPDHAPGAAPLRGRLDGDVPVLGFEGGRDDFEPDAEIDDGHTLRAAGVALRAVHTPGHASNHLCYLLEEERLLFSGDHVMDGSTVVISPPDGDMATYLASLERVRSIGAAAIAPGHGGVIGDPTAKLDEYVAHRLAREATVLAALEEAGPATIEQLVPLAYRDVHESRHAIAQFSLWAHLRKLVGDGLVACAAPDDMAAEWVAVERS